MLQNFRHTKSRGHKWIIVNSCNAVGRVGLGRPCVSEGGVLRIVRGIGYSLDIKQTKGNKMKIYGIMQAYEGYFDSFYQDKKHAEKFLANYLVISGKEDYSDDFSVIEIDVK